MSTVPTSTRTPLNVSIRPASRRASGAPRVGMPTRTRDPRSGPAFSINWWAIRSTTRPTSSAENNGAVVGSAGSADDSVIAASFPASRDGSLKEWAVVDAAAPAAVWTADDGTAQHGVTPIAPVHPALVRDLTHQGQLTVADSPVPVLCVTSTVPIRRQSVS